MNMTDIGLLVLVYIYVIIIFVISEKFLKDKPSFSRRFVHIMVGNCIFVMPFFNDPYTMVWFLTLPITIAAFLLTKYSPIKIKSGVTDAGHALGLVYYAGIWTFLIFLLPDKLWIVGVAIGAMVYGDGFASLIGQKYGKHHFNLTGDVKSVEGSITMFIMVCIMCSAVFLVYGAIGYNIPNYNFAFVVFISLIATVCEAVTPKGLDNLSVSSVSAVLYYILMV
ncbi:MULTISPECIES: diacylglycerol/polyprenol kinase family protein [Methanobrevibacter]|uniref:diacylglycerol/polyprenol kinase family protein n=1 Tax=Methanobrevibacter TaxID=2172 RepID=UPI000368D4A6|nr:diacylglycerol/polyprenol kinase family protein [Methanobrevibacter smithii]